MMLAEYVNVDAKAMMVVLFWTNLAAIGVNLTYRATSKRRITFPELKLHTLSKLCQAITFFLLLSRPALPDLLTVNVSNSLFLVAMYAESRSILHMLGLNGTRYRPVLAVLLAVSLAGFNAVEFLYGEPGVRIIAACVGVFVIIALPTGALLFGKNSDAFMRILGAFYGFFAVMQIVRSHAVLADPGIVYTSGGINSLVYLSLIILNIVASSLLFLVLDERLDEMRLAHQGELRAAMEAAQQASHLKTTFLASMSHEIRTPMNGIVGFAELALDDPDTSRRTRDYLRKINASAQGLLQIINDILDISKIEAGRIELESVPFSLHEVFLLCEAASAPKAREKGVTLFFYAEPAIGRKLRGDPTRLRQILLNLISNAVKFSNYGMVKITALAENIGDDETELHFEVKDSGIGMTAEQQKRIFAPFAQADDSITRRYGGTGLGLAITKGLVERMGGELRVESRLGIGSRFSFHIRLGLSDEPDGEPVPAGEEEQSGTPPRFSGDILVCEDNAINQDVIVEHLSRLGLSAFVAPNGQVGVDMAQKRPAGRPFDLIFMDIHMPVMGGLEAAARLRELGNKTPVVALTANVMTNDLDVYRDHGMEECLAKPFRTADLWDCLRRYLPAEETGEKRPAAERREAPPASAGRGGGVLDRELGLSRAANNGRLYQRLLATFRKDQATVCLDIEDAVDAGDGERAHRLAHSLKSASAMIGATRLSEAARVAEDALAGGRAGDAAGDALAALRRELRALLRELDGAEPPDAEESAEPVGEVVVDRARAAALLDRLLPLLINGNSACQEALPEVRAVLGPLDPMAATLAEQIEGFDFEQASETAWALRALLTV